ncbi:MAG: 4'-phosphopantetheinyl transferase superfamily protein [Alphaproteobacteria bacterium]|nr:4'-phosphopantetheinyl transferase superfamily protein [Alphaproteobacteria bacterium]
MDNSLSYFTYKSSLSLELEGKVTNVGLSLVSDDIDDLNYNVNEILHPQECMFYDALLYPKRKLNYFIGRYCAKQAISVHTQQNPFEILIENGAFQQPFISACDTQNVQVSISHTDTLGGAISFHEAYPMAIDLESIRKEKEETIHPLLKNEELILLRSLICESPLIMLWTIKEALSKAIKCGLTIPLDLLEVESVRKHGNLFISLYKNFPLYQAASFFLIDTVCTIIYPKAAQLHIDVLAIQKSISVFRRRYAKK